MTLYVHLFWTFNNDRLIIYYYDFIVVVSFLFLFTLRKNFTQDILMVYF